jgi:hypothetical protein
LLVLYILLACLDAGGKIIEHDPKLLLRVQQSAQSLGLHVRMPAHGINFDIFYNSTRHLLASQDLYGLYPETTGDRFKYSPTFALLFAPLAVLPRWLALLIWQLLNTLLPFYALSRLLDKRAANLAIGLVTLEVWRSMQNSQSNGIVVALMVLAFIALEQQRSFRAAVWIVLGTLIKIFPLAAGVFALPARNRWRVAGYVAGLLIAGLLLPALIVGPTQLLAQYQSWLDVERVDAQAQMQSIMGLLTLIGLNIPNLVVQVVGLAILLLPLVVAPQRWQDRQFRLLMLASTLIFVVVFNHQAERASYVIAFTGITIWYVTSPRGTVDNVLFWTAFILMPVASTLIPGRAIRTPVMTVLRLVVPSTVIWIVIQVRMLRATYTSPVATPVPKDGESLSPLAEGAR